MIGQYIHLAHQGISNPSHSMANGGGSDGGSSNPDTRYANLDKLYGIQSQASQYMIDNAMPIIPQVTANSVAMNNEAQDGTLGIRARNLAGADASMAFGQNMDAVNRNTARFGADFNATRMGAIGNDAAIGGALGKASAMNKASQWGEDQKWNRNANLYGQVMGMNNGAMSGLSSAGAGLSNMNAQQNAMDAANAKGYGQAGAAFSNGLFKAAGGYIEGESRRINEPKMATGGNAWTAYKAANPIAVGSSGSGRSRTNPYTAMLMGAAPQALGAGLKDVFNVGGKGGKLKGLYDKYANGKSSLSTGDEASLGQTGTLGVDSAGNLVGSGADSLSYATSLGGDITPEAYNAMMNLDTASTVAEAAPVVAEVATEAAPVLADAAYQFVADGGYIQRNGKKPGLHFALGGLSSSTMASSDKTDNTGMAKLDASNSLQLAKMDDMPKQGFNTDATHAKPVYNKPVDPDGFGEKSADNRHAVGKAVLSYWINVPGVGGVVADAIHPAMEGITREAIMTGDRIGKDTLGGVIGKDAAGFVGAASIDPVGAVFSGKYFAKGGRVDMKPGGRVAGPGTATSDDIPAWLSDGEHVQNAVSTKIAGKDTLDKINKAGVAVRQGKATPAQAKKQIGLAMLKRGEELAEGKKDNPKEEAEEGYAKGGSVAINAGDRMAQIKSIGLGLRKGKADPMVEKQMAGLAMGGSVKRKGC